MGVDAAGMFWVADTPPLAVLVGPTGLVSERDGTQVETFLRPFGDTLLGVNPNHVRKELSIVAHAAAHPFPHGRRPVDGLGNGDQFHAMPGEKALGLDQDHLVAGPSVQCVNHHSVKFTSSNIVQQLFENRPFPDGVYVGRLALLTIYPEGNLTLILTVLVESPLLGIQGIPIYLGLGGDSDVRYGCQNLLSSGLILSRAATGDRDSHLGQRVHQVLDVDLVQFIVLIVASTIRSGGTVYTRVYRSQPVGRVKAMPDGLV
jgi:hypothetical protein